MAYRQTENTLAKKAGTRARILKEARMLVSRGGFNAAAVAPVAKHSGIATGTIYRHFPSKAELVAEVFKHATEHELTAVVTATQVDGSAVDRLTRGVETFSVRALKAPRLAYALIAEPVDPLVEKERLSYRLAYAEAFEDLINDGIRAGEFVPQSASVTSAALVGMLAEALVGPLSPHALTDDPEADVQPLDDKEQQDLLDDIVALALRAVGAKQ